MNNKIKKLFLSSAHFCSAVSIITGQLISWLIVGMAIVLAANVLSSWLFNKSAILLTESVTWMHSANFLLAAAYTLNQNEHVRVDIFYAKMSSKTKATVNLAGTLCLLIPFCLFILWASWSYVEISWKLNEASAEAGGMPAIYLQKSFLIVMPILLLIEAFNQMFIHINTLTSDEPTALDLTASNSIHKGKQ